ncbi:tRNA synthetases class I-domain-containing protein [Phialemonium atrogriseum]|uniref:Isoleucine--tRNA ligase, cytoplasmic n=1 Tax=Phialemonium atrogriseum TaxID=1093897 RepID=A0AAJ0BZT8_9PEZI|nr:tRNA synthetases class I-domain-containing protein [Phialemonium atrogriseum]KAK1766144.1 tRNA synthetases class I-domain-containing protein [Phialemonium atrogriseum]
MSINFSKTEEETLRYWREIDAFQTQLRLTEGSENFTFYDGPPFATGLPHYGHLLTSTIKDIIPRYWSMKGYHVIRRFGWDTHGVPVEFEIDKKLGISGRDAVLKMGIDKYNAECRAIVMRYAGEWREIIERLGRWIDFDNDYKSMDTTFMESCWWVFKQLFEKDQVYRAYQIMPFSTALCTPLSQMESKENEKMTQDPSILVSFPVLEQPDFANTSLVIYTTTPWTLPSNLLIAAHPDFEYMVILDEKSGNQYILLEVGLSMLYKDPKKAKYKVIKKVKGKDMIGWQYKPLFPYFAEKFSDCFRVIGADYVEAEEGTGLVHQAPAFGQEDYDAAVAAGYISPKRLPPCPVDEKGQFTSEISDYAGQHVKTADKAILKDLRLTGRLLVESQVTHVDKFCWRSDTQLIRKAVSSWFIRVASSREDILQNLEATNWVPQFVRDKRFANWVSNAHDWNVSRNRYWGTPLPLWVSEDYEEVICVGSIEELRELSGFEGSLDDIHREKIDGITIPSRKGKGVLRRVDEVFDCWFESGSMPYASNHYPFENADAFQKGRFPADFIAEGLDQTRGWFYTLSVLGNHLFGTSPFKNCIVNGLVLAEDGKKMSKSLKNYPDPSAVINLHGSDALRLYLINSPVVRAEPMRFKESGVKEVVSKVLLPLWNSYRFFYEQANLFKKITGNDFVAQSLASDKGVSNVMDRWILADCQSMLRFINEEMNGYRLYTVVPRLLQVIDNLTNWYIRFNRKRIKGAAGLGIEDTNEALSTLCQVLFTLVRALAPFMPFITEHIYGLLTPYLGDALAEFKNTQSVHFLSFPTVQENLFDEVIERKVSAMQAVIQLGRTTRERKNIALKTPLLSMVVIADTEFLADVESLLSYVKDELNVRDVILTTDEEKYNIVLEARVDWPTLGKKLKKNVQVVRKALPSLKQEELKQYLRERKLTVGGIELEGDDLTIVRILGQDTPGSSDKEGPQYEPSFSRDVITLLDTASHPELVDEGLTRDLINRVQRMRKKAGLVTTDDIHMQYSVVSNPDNVDLDGVISSRQDAFVTTLRGKLEPLLPDGPESRAAILEEEHTIGNLTLLLKLAHL